MNPVGSVGKLLLITDWCSVSPPPSLNIGCLMERQDSSGHSQSTKSLFCHFYSCRFGSSGSLYHGSTVKNVIRLSQEAANLMHLLYWETDTRSACRSIFPLVCPTGRDETRRNKEKGIISSWSVRSGWGTIHGQCAPQTVRAPCHFTLHLQEDSPLLVLPCREKTGGNFGTLC